MNRDHQAFLDGFEAAQRWGCDMANEALQDWVGDSTPPATPVECESWCRYDAGRGPRCSWCLVAHPPAVSGEGERLIRQAFRSGWNGGFTAIPDESTLNQQEEQDWEVFVRNWLRASTPTPGAPR